jgi:hypothetical protein
MNMISDTADAHNFGIKIAADCGQIRMHTRPHVAT